jgi:hypothetical protein
MGVILIEGFEAGSITVNNLTPTLGAMETTTPCGPWSIYGCRGSSNASPAKKAFTVEASEVYGAFRWYAGSNQSLGDLFRLDHPDGNISFRLGTDASARLQVKDTGGTVIATGTTVLAGSTPHLCEFHAKVGDAGTGFVDVRIDGLTVTEVGAGLSAPWNTNIDTKSGTNTTVFAYGLPLNSVTYDDIVIHDLTGSLNNSWVGDKAVIALRPEADGAHQWLPIVPSSQRFYFPRPQTYPAKVLPTPDSQWERTADVGIYRAELAPVRRNTSQDASQAIGFGSGLSTNGDNLALQYISHALAAQTISGTFKMQMATREDNSARDLRAQIVIRVVSADGLTVRGVLYAGDTSGLTSEFNTSQQSRKFPQAAVSPGTLSSVAALDGDRLVIEVGARTHAASPVGVADSWRVGDNQTTDLPEDETTTSFNNPWIEFSNAITLSGAGNWEAVDDDINQSGPDEDYTYVKSVTTNDRDLYVMQNIPGSMTAAGAISIKSRARKVDPGARALRHVYKTSGAEQSSSDKSLTLSYAYQETLLDADGTDSAAWTDAKLNSLQVGPQAR